MEALRRKFLLSSDDTEYLDNAFPEWEAIDGRWILLHNFPVRPGFTVQNVTAAIQIPSGYPQTRLDMVYFHPAVLRADDPGSPLQIPNPGVVAKTFPQFVQQIILCLGQRLYCRQRV